MTIRIASIGDSFTEGVGDELPDGTALGWADRVAAGLAAAHPDEDVYYASFAIRGRLLAPIATEQLDAALALDPPPTHLTFNGGGNDIMRPGYSDERMAALTSRVLDMCAERGTHVVILSGPDPSDRLPGGKRMRALGTQLTELVEGLVVGRENVTFVDNFRDVETRRAPYWSVDRLHLNSLGHERVASRVLTALGVVTEPPAASDAHAAPTGIVGEMAYWRAYVLPWIGRRLTGRSSGDGRSPKFPEWTLMPASSVAPGDEADVSGGAPED